MTSPIPSDTALEALLASAREAAAETASLDAATVNATLNALADETELRIPELLSANAADLARMSPDEPKYDRLQLTAERIRSIAADLRKVAVLPSPAGRILQETVRPNGMTLQKVAVPFGVVAVIYEARPNVTFDVFSLCLKSGNACVLKGGSDAENSNRAIAQLIGDVLRKQGLNPHIITLLPSDRKATEYLLQARDYIDLLIPRGSAALIQYVRREATVPVIETGAGVCHTYFDAAGDLEKGKAIVCNAKTRRVSVCNALDCLLVHRHRLADLPALCAALGEKNVRLYSDPEAFRCLQGHYPDTLLNPATEESYGTEFLSYALAIRTVGSLDEALRTQRVHRDRRECRGRTLPARGGCRLRLPQRLHGLHRRRPVWAGSRNRDQHPETPCPRPHGTGRTLHLQMARPGERADPPLSGKRRKTASKVAPRRGNPYFWPADQTKYLSSIHIKPTQK